MIAKHIMKKVILIIIARLLYTNKPLTTVSFLDICRAVTHATNRSLITELRCANIIDSNYQTSTVFKYIDVDEIIRSIPIDDNTKLLNEISAIEIITTILVAETILNKPLPVVEVQLMLNEVSSMTTDIVFTDFTAVDALDFIYAINKNNILETIKYDEAINLIDNIAILSEQVLEVMD